MSVLSVTTTQNLFQEPQVAVGHVLNQGHPRSAVDHGPGDRQHTASSLPPTLQGWGRNTGFLGIGARSRTRAGPTVDIKENILDYIW